MRIKVLIVDNNDVPGRADAEMLKDRGFMVYSCHNACVDEMVKEIKPNVIFINPDTPGLESTKVYHELLEDVTYASIPVIYTLVEDDMYLIHGKRTLNKVNKKLIADNIIDSIKTSLSDKISSRNRKMLPVYHQLHPGTNFRRPENSTHRQFILCFLLQVITI